MARPQLTSEPSDTSTDHEDEPSGVPGWMKVLGVVAVLVNVAVVVAHLTGYGMGSHSMAGMPGTAATGKPSL